MEYRAGRDVFCAREFPSSQATPSPPAGRSRRPLPTATGCSADTLRLSRERCLPRDDPQLREQRENADRERPAIKLLVSHDRARVDGRALQQIDLGVDVLKRGRVPRAEVSATRHARNVAEEGLVDFYRLILVPKPTRGGPTDRYQGHSDAAHSDAVDLYPVRGGCLRRDQRLDAATVVDLSLIHISEPTRLGMISYAVFCLKKKK